MKKTLLTAITAFSLCMAPYRDAHAVELPVKLDYPLITKALLSQLYTGESHSADLWHDKQQCSFLKLSDPQISGQNGQLRFLNKVNTQFGTAFGGQCVTLMKWNGMLETLQQPTLSKDGTVLSAPVTKATAYDQQGQELKIDKLQELLTRHAQPWLAELKIDLKKSRGDIEKSIAPYLPPERLPALQSALKTLAFSKAQANDDGIALGVNFTAPKAGAPLKAEPPFNASEQLQWQQVWEKWDASMNSAIQRSASGQQNPELQTTLTDILQNARVALQAGLQDHDRQGDDPVRVFFTESWERLSPLLSKVSKDLPEIDGLRYLSFIAATDVLYEVENRLAPFGLAISSDGLRRMARTLIAEQPAQSAHP
ncbi:hypothetical protein JCM14076_04610 [Methylosoma difficile]